MKFPLSVLLATALLASAWAGENRSKPIDPAKELWNVGDHVCAYLPGAGERQACVFDLKDFTKAYPVPCSAKDRAIAKLKLSQALCEHFQKTKDKATGEKAVKLDPSLGSNCWHQFVRTISGKDAKPFVEGQAYDLSKLDEAVAWAGATCVGKDRYHGIDSACMHAKMEELEAMFSLQGINEGPSPGTYACVEGAGDPVLAEGQTAPAKPEIQPRIVTTAELPAAVGAQIVK